MNKLRISGGVALLMLLAGCASNDVMLKRQTETETRLEHLFQLAGIYEARLNEISGTLATMQEKESQQVKFTQDLADTVKELKESDKVLKAKLENYSLVATPKVELVNPEPPQKGKESGPPQKYLKAFGLYSANNFKDAIQAFELFIKEQPASDFVPNAQYWIGECYYSSSNLPKALESFQTVVDRWPAHPKASDALLKIGYSYTSLKQQGKARESFERLIRSYPGSPATEKARERLMATTQPTPVRH